MKKKLTGVTLIELLAVIAVSGILLASLTKILIIGHKNYSKIERGLSERREILQIVETLKFHLSKNKQILLLNSNNVSIWKQDKNNDGKIQVNEIIRFNYSDGELKITVNNNERIIKLTEFKLYPDCSLPETNHIIFKIESKKNEIPVYIFSSISINSERKINL